MKPRFEKISFKEFCSEMLKDRPGCFSTEQLENLYKNIKLPTRATEFSAGYDFYSPFSFALSHTNKSVVFSTGVRVILPKNYALLIIPKSGIGFRTGTRLANTVGLIDADYKLGIKAKLVYGFDDLFVGAGEKVMQGIIVKYKTTKDKVKAKRNGGFGSTGK